jgi:hypothetical protein
LAYRQCQERRWLEVRRPTVRENSARRQAVLKAGHHVGDIARHQYDLRGRGALLDSQPEGLDQVFAKTQDLREQGRPIFGYARLGSAMFGMGWLKNGKTVDHG